MGARSGVGPVPGDQSAMPGKDGGRGDESVPPQRLGEEPDQGAERGPVGPVHPRPGVGSAQDCIFVMQDRDLDVFGRVAAGEQGQPFGGAAEREVEQA